MTPRRQVILLVEDSPDDVELTLLAMRHGGRANRIDVVRDGAEALDYLFCQGAYAERDPNTMPRAVLLDIKLPLVDGIDVLRAIKTDPRTQSLPVVMLTSSAQGRDLAACYHLGVNSYVVKPVDVDRFFAAVQQVGAYWLTLNQMDSV